MPNLRASHAARYGLLLLLFLVPAVLAACTPHHDLSTFGASGPVAEDQKNNFLLIFWVAVGVFIVVEGALIYGARRFRKRGSDEGLAVQAHGNLRLEIAWTIAPVIILVAIAIPTVDLIYRQSVAPTGRVDPENPLEINVIGHQWWWEIDYPGEDVITANEVNIPVGRAIKVNITSDDVLHSFWVPKLGGKVDLIPGSTNFLWLQADEPGVYLGQCAEFCGVGHAMMRYRVRARTPADFQAWLESMRRPPEPLDTDDEKAGQLLFAQNCSTCHSTQTYQTILARSERQTQTARQGAFVANPEESLIIAAPNLTHIATRLTIGAGIIEFNQENLESWIADPKNIKRGTRMRKLAAVYDGGPAKLTEEEVSQIAAYLLAQTPTEADTVVTEETVSGEALFAQQGCSGCHRTGPETDVLVGPGLGGLKDRAVARVEGLSAEEYVRQSIVEPNAFVVDGFDPVMLTTFGDIMSAEEIDALVDYLLTLE